MQDSNGNPTEHDRQTCRGAYLRIRAEIYVRLTRDVLNTSLFQISAEVIVYGSILP